VAPSVGDCMDWWQSGIPASCCCCVGVGGAICGRVAKSEKSCSRDAYHGELPVVVGELAAAAVDEIAAVVVGEIAAVGESAVVVAGAAAVNKIISGLFKFFVRNT